MEYINKHVNELKKFAATMSKLRSVIAPIASYESTKFASFLDELVMGDRISWTELDDRDYSGTVTAYIDHGTSNSGVEVTLEYGVVYLRPDNGHVIVKAQFYGRGE